MSSTAATKKRKSDASSSAASKKAKLAAAANNAVQADAVDNILSNATNFELPENTSATRDTILKLAEYARSLEEEIDSMKPKEKAASQIIEEASKLARVACSGIKKQMTWKPTCKQSRAKWAYDGVCQDPKVFGKLMGLDGPPNFKSRKFSAQDFQNFIGNCQSSARYSHLDLTSDVNVQWKPDEGTFKFTGMYGV